MLQSFTNARYRQDSSGAPAATPAIGGPLLVGWLRRPVAALRVNGRDVPGPAVTLFLIHLNG